MSQSVCEYAGQYIHVVVGGEGWQQGLPIAERPDAIHYTGELIVDRMF